jgi:hypothetical protein
MTKYLIERLKVYYDISLLFFFIIETRCDMAFEAEEGVDVFFENRAQSIVNLAVCEISSNNTRFPPFARPVTIECKSVAKIQGKERIVCVA